MGVEYTELTCFRAAVQAGGVDSAQGCPPGALHPAAMNPPIWSSLYGEF